MAGLGFGWPTKAIARGVAFLVGAAILAGLVFLFLDAFGWDDTRVDPVQGTATAVGTSIFSRFVLPFEAISFLLLAALIGAIVLSRKDDPVVRERKGGRS